MKYLKLGKLPKDTVQFFLEEILKRKVPGVPYQWIQFDDYLHAEFLKIFANTDLKIQHANNSTRPIQKAFYSEPGHGFRIHKDGIKCKSALNIAISCNKDDWVRWYDDDYINKIATLDVRTNLQGVNGSSRDTNIYDYDDVPFIEELKNEIGDIYVLDVDTYHSFKCVGDKPRIIIQTKFEGFPEFSTIKESLSKQSFENILSC